MAGAFRDAAPMTANPEPLASDEQPGGATAYLLSHPANKQMLLEGIDQLNRGGGVEHEMDLEA